MSREDAQGLAALVKSWDTARDAVRIARGKPLPGSMRPENKKPKAPPAPRRGPVGPAAEALEHEPEVQQQEQADNHEPPAAPEI